MLEVLLLLALIGLLVGAWSAIFRQAGYSGPLGLLAIIPGAVVVLPFVIALLDWPVRKEASRLRVALGEGTEADASYLLSRGVKLEQRGEWERAISFYRLVADGMKDQSSGDDAIKLIENVREKQAMAC